MSSIFGKMRFLLLVSLLLIGSVTFPKITFWFSWEGEEWFEEIAEAFEKETGLDVEVTYVPNIWKKLSMILMGGGKLPDICLVKNENLESMERYRTLPSLDELGLDESIFKERMLEAFKVRGKVKTVPFYADVQIAYINLDLFERLKLDIPKNSWDFEDFVEILREIKERGDAIPTAMGLFSPYFFFGLQAGLGSGVDDNGIRVDTKENVKLIELLRKLHDEGLIMNITRKRPIMVQKFVKGELAILPHGSFLIRKFEKKRVNFVIRVLPKPWKGIIDPKGFVVFRNEEEVREFLKFVLRNSEEFVRNYIKVPALKGISPRNKYIPTLNEAFESGVLQPSTVEFERYWEIMEKVLELAITGKMDVVEALKRAQSYIEGGK